MIVITEKYVKIDDSNDRPKPFYKKYNISSISVNWKSIK